MGTLPVAIRPKLATNAGSTQVQEAPVSTKKVPVTNWGTGMPDAFMASARGALTPTSMVSRGPFGERTPFMLGMP